MSAAADPAVILAVGTALASVLAATAAVVKTLREPTAADLLARVISLETRFTRLVRWYADERLRLASRGIALEPIPASLLVSTR